MMILSPHLLVAAAQSHIGLGEDPGPRRGQVVELFLHSVHQPPEEPWSAAFVWHCGYWSHFDAAVGTSSWPIPPYGTCQDMAAYAKERNALLEEDPTFGDIYMMHSPSKKCFLRCGIVVEVVGRGGKYSNGKPYVEAIVIEGNSGIGGSANGPAVVLTKRQLSIASGDRTLRWTNLDPRVVFGNPMKAFDRMAGRLILGTQWRAA